MQRLTALDIFLSGKLLSNKSGEKDFKISNKIEITEEIRGKKLNQIKVETLNIIKESSLPITIIRCDLSNPDHMEYVYKIFNRLNSGGTKLTPQQIRNALNMGDYCRRIKVIATKNEDFKQNITTLKFAENDTK